MGVEPYLVGSSLVGVLAQRLVRVLCKECREAYLPTPEELREIGIASEATREPRMIYRAVGCEACNSTGYHGRTGIYETMLVDDAIRELAVKKVDSGSIKRAAVHKGMRTLMEDGGRKVLRGVTSVAEVLSVTQEDLG